MALISEERISQLRTLADEVSQREGCFLYDLEFTGGPRSRVLRVFIDKDPGPVSLDDCANVSRGLNLLLDVEDIIPGGAYDLEVSTPGLERKLTQDWHFDKATGELVQIKSKDILSPPEGVASKREVKSLKGRLIRVDGDNLVISDDKNEWLVPRNSVQKAQVIFEAPVKQPLKQKNKKKKR